MLHALALSEQRKFHWQSTYFWRVIPSRKRFVVSGILLGALIGLMIGETTSPVFASRALVCLNMCRHGVPEPDFVRRPSCARCAEEALPFFIRWACRVD